jgi:hypothetical protein
MSQKITSKNLSYEQNLPPFLAALHGQAAGNRDGPDPILSGRRRPVKPRSGSAEAEDEPLVLDEEGNEVAGVKVGVDGAVTETTNAAKETAAGDSNAVGKDDASKAEDVAGLGAARKRKAAKVVGGDVDDHDSKKGADAGAQDPVEKKSSKGKKKAKKIKLSFGDDDGD